jgi:hypothetical protein
MSGTMSLADLVADLKASLHDAASVFTAAADADFERLLNIAASALGWKRPRRLRASLTLVADTADYPAPAGMLYLIQDAWSDPSRLPPPWEPSHPGALPRVSVVEIGGVQTILFSPAPSAAHILALGSDYSFIYRAAHSISATAASTTIQPDDRGLLLLRAQVEALREIALRNSAKPVAMRDGLSGMPKNGTASYLFEILMREFEEAL